MGFRGWSFSIGKDLPDDRGVDHFFLKAHALMVKFFRFALWWIVLGGIPRTIFYKSFEWANAADKLQVPALMVKHVVMAVLVVWGVYAWRKLKRKVALLRQSVGEEAKK